MTPFFITLTISILSFIIAGLILFLIRRKKLTETFSLKLLLIRFPKKNSTELLKKGVGLSSRLFNILTVLKSPFCLETAVHHIGEEINFYAAVPEELAEIASQQIKALWKEAEIGPADDYNIFNPNGVNAGVYLKQKLSYALPVKNSREANFDAFSPVISGFLRMNEVGEGAAVQILVKPASQSFKKSILVIINNLKNGAKFSEAIKGGKIRFKKFRDKKEKEIDEKAIKIMESRIGKPLFEVNLRFLVSAPSQYQADAILENITAGFSQLSETRIIKPRRHQNLIRQFSFREFDNAQSMILNVEELSTLFYLPDSSIKN